MKIASETSFAEKITKFLRPVMKILFPKMKKDSKLYKEISMNMVANILGLGNAATPLGIKAMKTMQENNTDKKVLDSSNTEIDYYFTIKNYNDIKKSDVDLKYNIEITPIQDKAIILSLYKDNQKIELTNQKTQYVDLLHSNNIKHEYRLNVKYDKSNLGNCYDISSNIFIKANAIQK